MLHLREMSVDKLARLSKVGRCQLNLMLSGKRNGMQTWKHVDPFLHPGERDVLRRTTSYSRWEGKASYRRNGTDRTNGADMGEIGEVSA